MLSFFLALGSAKSILTSEKILQYFSCMTELVETADRSVKSLRNPHRGGADIRPSYIMSVPRSLSASRPTAVDFERLPPYTMKN